jgi:glycerophosphoryl diester phosphodiesterase
MAAFALALQMGSTHLELDVHLTRDDQLVVIPDDTTSHSGYNSQPCRPVLRTLNKWPPPVVT